MLNVRALLGSPKALAAAGAVGVAALALHNKSKVKSSATPAVAPGTSAYGSYDSTSSDLYNSLEPILQGLGQQQQALGQALSNLSQPASGPPSVVPGGLPPQIYSGSGLGPFTPSQLAADLAGHPPQGANTPPPVTGADGGTYIWVETPDASATLGRAGVPQYVQPAPGVFVPEGDASKLKPGTPLFVKSGP